MNPRIDKMKARKRVEREIESYREKWKKERVDGNVAEEDSRGQQQRYAAALGEPPKGTRQFNKPTRGSHEQ